MTEEQLAALRARTANSNELNKLAQAANGHGVTSVERRRAEAQLEAAVGTRKAKRLREDALRQAGARGKGLGRWFG
ncbi:hypothetical protein ACWDA3_53220 [Nonomuraea rubra]|uniref:DUF3618 domain-containing protein n=1 Tax=Nonomuraea composti TaxID=2720023 RepID=A0ABX1BLW9_9ACTN|nr:hypothetical protein [Nonomuraea sp. FMUSA5-5]NJP98739.1 hypothetical protein [Nonomuraea sp. FMUSA5-5]